MSIGQLVSTPVCLTFLDLLRRRATNEPDRRAYTFLLDGESEEVHITYGEMDKRARAIGALLQQNIPAGDTVLLLYPPGLDYIAAFFGCLYAGVIAVPVYPPNPARLERTLPRLRGILLDACPTVVLTTSTILPVSTKLVAQDAIFAPLTWLATDMLTGEEAAAWHEPQVDGNTIAFLQYTSGSTATPKGVMVSHSNLLHNEAIIQQAFELTEASIGVSWLPLYHDMGLIGNVLQPLYTGFSCILLSPVDFLQKPLRWLQAITRYHATTSGGPNFAYDLCVNRITPEQRSMLDLRSWSLAYNGAESVRHETLEHFSAFFEPCGFRHKAFFPCYGLAEATLLVSGGPKVSSPFTLELSKINLEQNRVLVALHAFESTSTLLSSGQIRPSQQVVIAHPATLTRCLPDQVGEVWVASTSVAQGYWKQPEASAQTFRAFLKDTGEGPFLRTGDLGFIRDENLFITSRLKDVIIIRGRNHIPQDIERTVEMCHPSLRPGCGAAIAVDLQSEERLVIIHEVKRQSLSSVNIAEVAAAIRQAVGEQHELQVNAVVLLKTGTLPKTSSGKIQRHACRDGFLQDSLQKIGESIIKETRVPGAEDDSISMMTLAAFIIADPTQRLPCLVEYLQQQIARAVGADPSLIRPDQPLMASGVDSLRILELKQRIETDLGVDVPLERFIDYPTLTQLAAFLLDALERRLDSIWAEIMQMSDKDVDMQLAKEK